MGNIMIPITIAVGQKYSFFKAGHYKFIGNDKIEEGVLLNSTNDSVDPYDYHMLKWEGSAFKTMECNHFHSFNSNEESDEEDNDEGDIWRA